MSGRAVGGLPAVSLETPGPSRREEFVEAVARSRELHRPWVEPPGTSVAYRRYLERISGESHLGYFVVTGQGELAGVVNVNEIVRGLFQSAYLGYYAFVPHQGRGCLTAGLGAVVTACFREHGLHRLEANVQPDNAASLALVRRLGFRREGFSPRYLRIGGRWRDHERWAVTSEEWTW